MKGKRRFQYVKYAKGQSPLENLKNQLADNDHTFRFFYEKFYRMAFMKLRHCTFCKPYEAFLADINWYEVWTAELKLAYAEYEKFLQLEK